MSIYDNEVFNSDVDAYKNSGQIRTASLTFGGSVGAGAAYSATTSLALTDIPDLTQILFDNNVQHSGKYKNLVLEGITLVHESTRNSYLTIVLSARINGNTIELRGDGFNPYNGAVVIDSTTLNFRYIPYEATF